MVVFSFASECIICVVIVIHNGIIYKFYMQVFNYLLLVFRKENAFDFNRNYTMEFCTVTSILPKSW